MKPSPNNTPNASTFSLPSREMQQPDGWQDVHYNAIYDPESNEYTISFLKAKFGKKCDDILERFGAIESVWNDSHTEIIDVATPEKYLQDIDEKILYALATGSKVEDEWVPTPQTLLKLARAEASYLESIAFQLRTNPEYLQSVIEAFARNRDELVPDANGDAPKVEDLLNNAQFIALQFRYTIHNTLLVLGQWTLVARYLDDLVAAEQEYGYGKAFPERSIYLDGARDIVEQAMEITARIIVRAIKRHKMFDRLWIRVETFEEKWTGAKHEPVSNADSSNLFQSRDLAGALYRFALQTYLDDDVVEDLLDRFNEKGNADVELDNHLAEHITRLQSFFNFYKLLGLGDKSPHYRPDRRLLELKSSSELAQKILNGAPIERHIKGIPSLGQQTPFKKIWKDVDDATLKKAKTSLEKLVGYGELPPPRLIPRRKPRPRAPAPQRQIESLSPPESVSTSQREPFIEHEPVKLTPVSYLSDSKPQPIDKTPIRVGPKKKTVGTPGTPERLESTDESIMTEKAEGTLGRIQFLVKKWVYDIFERVFKGGKGVIEQDDFVKAMCSIGCEKKEGAGSRVWLYLPPDNQPMILHKIHNKTPEMSAGYVVSYRKALETVAGWSMETFVLSTPK